MNAAEYAQTAARLGQALREAGLLIERAESRGGTLYYTPVPAPALLGRLLQIGLRVSSTGTTAAALGAVRQGDGDPGHG